MPNVDVDKILTDFSERQETERKPGGFLDLAVRSVRCTAFEAEVAAKAEGATAKSVLRAVRKNLDKRVSDLRTAGRFALGLQLPTQDEGLEQSIDAAAPGGEGRGKVRGKEKPRAVAGRSL